jgi:GT2 family glycosyltransferase
MSQLDVSVLLVSWNTCEETRDCLDSLTDGVTDGLRYEVVAVDNGSRDSSAEMLARYPGVHLIRNESNVGFAAAVNQAYRQATGRLILLLNSDVRFHKGSLSTMAAFLRDRPGAAGVSPLCLNPDGSFQQHYIAQPSFAAALALVTVLRRVPGFRGALHTFRMLGQDFSRPRQLASGSCLLLRANALHPDSIFDERFPIYWNDAVLARELADAGHRLWMIPEAQVTHSRGSSCRLLGPNIRFRHLLGSLVGYLRLTQPAYRLPVFRAVVLADHALKRLAGRPVTLGLGDLRAALRGDVGPLPDGDVRYWLVFLSARPWSVNRRHKAVTAALAAKRRVLFVEPASARPVWRFAVRAAGPALWRATPPTVLPFGRWLAPANWVNRRVTAALLRRWLDGHPGSRILRVDDERGGAVIGRLGEDAVVPAATPARSAERARG